MPVKPDAQQTIVDPDGYVAPPLDGVWASPPYFHNGSVPTLWHVLHPSTATGGLAAELPKASITSRSGFRLRSSRRCHWRNPMSRIRRSYFDTRRFGKSNAGHNFPDQLSDEEKTAVLEYLKTL